MPRGWTDEELAASVEAYRRMAQMEAIDQSLNKAQIYRDLSEKFDRTAGAFEYRMQNISALYQEIGLPWIPGLKPADHIGTDVRPRLLKLIEKSTANLEPSGFKYGEKRTWELVLDAIVALGGVASRLEVRAWLRANHPNYNEKNLVDLEMLSVNSSSRTSYNQNAAPRLTDTGALYDRLFKIGRSKNSRFEQYVPELHGIWEIYPDGEASNRHGMGVRRAEDPVITGLAKASAEEESVDAFNPQSVTDARRKVLAEIYRRQGQPGFRQALRQAYDDTCAITGCKLVQILEAAHVHPYKGEHTNIASNGLLLRADIHTLFDLYFIAIDSSTMTTLIAPVLCTTEYADLAGQPIRIPPNAADRPSVAALDWHRSLCVW